jgi:RHS repeat-associated protein
LRVTAARRCPRPTAIRYNGAGERVYRSGSNDVVHTVFDPAGQWIGDYDANGIAIQQAIWFDGLPVGLVRNAGTTLDLHYVEADALGTPRVVIDPTRDVAVWRWDLTGEAFGESEQQQDPDGDETLFVLDLRYPGQQYDSASGFNYNYFRDYDPSIGRYVQSDPIGLAGGASTYGYAGGNPLQRIDQRGLQSAEQPGPFDPGAMPSDPMLGPRDPRTPWLPSVFSVPRKYCSPYYRVDSGRPTLGLILIPLAKEDMPQRNGCKLIVICHYAGESAFEVDQATKQAVIGSTEFEVEIELDDGSCACN